MTERFPEKLRKLRLLRRVSKKALGELCGLSKNMIARYESGEREPSVKSLIALADYFGVALDELIGREDYD